MERHYHLPAQIINVIYVFLKWCINSVYVYICQVRELPAKAEVIAWSEKTGIEMFSYGNHFMGIQGHPEYTRDILLHLVDRLLQRNLIIVCSFPSNQLILYLKCHLFLLQLIKIKIKMWFVLFIFKYIFTLSKCV